MEELNPFLTDEQLSTIEDMSANLMPPADIAIMVNIPSDKFEYLLKHQKNHPLYLAYHKGRIKTKLELNRIIIKLAIKGSPQAEQLASKMLKDQNII